MFGMELRSSKNLFLRENLGTGLKLLMKIVLHKYFKKLTEHNSCQFFDELAISPIIAYIGVIVDLCWSRRGPWILGVTNLLKSDNVANH